MPLSLPLPCVLLLIDLRRGERAIAAVDRRERALAWLESDAFHVP